MNTTGANTDVCVVTWLLQVVISLTPPVIVVAEVSIVLHPFKASDVLFP